MGESLLSKWTVIRVDSVSKGTVIRVDRLYSLRSSQCRVEKIHATEDKDDWPDDLVGADEENGDNRQRSENDANGLRPGFVVSQPENGKRNGKSAHQKGTNRCAACVVIDEARDRQGDDDAQNRQNSGRDDRPPVLSSAEVQEEER